MTINVNNATRNALATVIRNEYNGGQIQIRTGSKPAAGAPQSGTVLATLSLPIDWFGSPSGGVTSGASQVTAEVAVSGTPGHARIIGNTGVIHVDITAEGGAGPFIFQTGGAGLTDFLQAGGFVRLTAGSFTFPAE